MKTTREIYLTANESIHTLKLKDTPLYIFNDKGLIYYVFDTVKELFGYLRRGRPSGLFFEHESNLETYIKTKYALRAFKAKSQ